MSSHDLWFIVPFEILGTVNISFIFGTMMVLYYFREKPQVKIRNLFLVEIQLFFSGITITCLMFLPSFIDNTCVIPVVMFVALQGFLAAILVRCLLLKLAFNVSCDSVKYMRAAKAKIAAIVSAGSVPRESSIEEVELSSVVSSSDLFADKERLKRLQRNRFLFHRTSIIMIWLMISSVFWIAFLSQYLSSSTIRSRLDSAVGRGCGGNAKSNIAVLISCFLCFLGVAIFFHGFRKIHENFRLKAELRRLVLSTISVFGSILIIETLAKPGIQDRSDQKVIKSFRVVYFLISIYSTYTTISPVLFEFKAWKKNHSKSTSVVQTAATGGSKDLGTRFEKFRQVLNHPEAKRLFTKFLMKEFASENIFFIDAVNQMKETLANATESSKKHAQDQAVKIMELFCVDNAPLCINLSYVCRQNLIQKFERSKANGFDEIDIFEAAEKEINELLLKDSFPRFIRAHPVDRILEGELILSEDDMELVRVVSDV